MGENREAELADILRQRFGLSVDTDTARNLLRQAQSRGTGGYVQWMTSDGQLYYPASDTRPQLSPGVYEINESMQRGLFFDKIPASTEGLVRLPDTNGEKVIEEIRHFWEREELFRKYGLAYKRGIFMHGPPGSGKTCSIKMICNDVILRGGIVVKFSDPSLAAKGLRILREIQPDIPVVVLMEDLDSLIEHNIESEVINLLDGIDGVDKIVFLATSNYPEKLGERVVNRPSRFDRRFYIGPPSPECRKIFFKFLMSEKGQTGENHENMTIAGLDQWVKDTEGMSIAHLKELFVAVKILETPYEDAVEILRAMKSLPDSSQYSDDEEEIIDSGKCSGMEPCVACDDECDECH